MVSPSFPRRRPAHRQADGSGQVVPNPEGSQGVGIGHAQASRGGGVSGAGQGNPGRILRRVVGEVGQDSAEGADGRAV